MRPAAPVVVESVLRLVERGRRGECWFSSDVVKTGVDVGVNGEDRWLQ